MGFVVVVLLTDEQKQDENQEFLTKNGNECSRLSSRAVALTSPIMYS